MAFIERKQLYKKLEEKRKRPLITFINYKFITNYIMQPDTSLNINVLVKNGSWEREKGDNNEYKYNIKYFNYDRI